MNVYGPDYDKWRTSLGEQPDEEPIYESACVCNVYSYNKRDRDDFDYLYSSGLTNLEILFKMFRMEKHE